MKIKKKYSYKDKKQIWRLLITNTDFVIVEARDTKTREVYFSCFDIHSGKKLFKNLQMEEKSWIGIETIYKDVIYFHQYAKPDMPAHSRISAFDIKLKKELWKNDEFTFGFVTGDIVYARINTMVGEKYFPLDYRTGEILSEESVDEVELLELRNKYESEKDFSQYRFPEIFNLQLGAQNTVNAFIEKQTSDSKIVGNIEIIEYDNLLLMNYHNKISHEKIRNEFCAVNLQTEKNIFTETLNKNAKAFVPDSFFVYKNILILLKEKNEVIICDVVV